MLLWHLLTRLEIWNTFLFLSSFQFSGQPLVFGPRRFSPGGKKMEGVTANGISRMRFGIFSFMRLARCYLTVQQRNLGCHFARHQQRPQADSVSRVRSQVQKEFSTGGGGYANEASQPQETTEQHSGWSALIVTHNVKKWQSHSGATEPV